MSDLLPTTNLSAKRRALLELLLKKQNKGFSSFPLSFAQERLWFLHQWEPLSPLYNIFMALRLTGQMRVAALEQSINAIVQRHETLRTTFVSDEGRAVQTIKPTLHIPLPLINLEMLPESEREGKAHALAVAESHQPFDLSRGPLVRASLLRLGVSEHALLLTLHHIIADGWSMGIFIRELATLYGAFSAGRTTPLPVLPVQYADFVLWQREWLQGKIRDRQIAYWKQQLGGALTLLELPTDRPRPAVQTARGAHQNFIFPKIVSEQLRALGRQEETTLFMTLLATFQVLLFRYTGQQDILVGTPIANRNRTEIEGLIGFFVNMLVLRTNLAGSPDFRELLHRVRETCLGAYAHQDLPFEQLVEALQPERNLSHTPLFQVVFQLQNTPSEHVELPGLAISSLKTDTALAKFDLNITVMEDEHGLPGVLEYNTDLFDEQTINRLLSHWQTLLESIVANPDCSIEKLPLLTTAERQLILVRWNDTRLDYGTNRCAHVLFEEQVERTPEHIATVFGNEQLSYGELNRRANQLARCLRMQGVEAELLVALLHERSNDLLIAILAVFKAGGAYFALDPQDPPARLRQLLERSHCPFILTTTKFAPLLTEVLNTMPPTTAPQVMCSEQLPWQTQDENNLPVCNKLQNLAYVMYTSGSTGQPKGAMLEHRGMLNHLHAKIQGLNLTVSDSVAHTASQCFDISVWQFLAPLLVGGKVHIFDDEMVRDLAHHLEAFERYGITVFESAPSLLAVMLNTVESGNAERPPLAKVHGHICSGEALSPDLCRRWLKCYPSIPIVNAYGATECSDDVTYYWVSQPPATAAVRTPVGTPIRNMRQYVLDRYLEPVPVGIVGEVYFGGVGVGRGYLDDPWRTAEIFIADPFSDEPGARLYKTGDLARYLPDGNLDFLGRIDHQVKIRGFRIELEEIEAALREHASLRDVLVIAHKGASQDKQLVAYIVARQQPAPTTSELRGFLKTKLPDYMVPTIFMPLDAMPLNANGKVERRALPEPRVALTTPAVTFTEPGTPLEERLAQVWRNTLALEQVGIYDNFFEIGGHSLLATQLVSRLRTIFQVELSLRAIFEAPTISAQAEVIAQRLAEQIDSDMLAALEELSQDDVQTALDTEKQLREEGISRE